MHQWVKSRSQNFSLAYCYGLDGYQFHRPDFDRPDFDYPDFECSKGVDINCFLRAEACEGPLCGAHGERRVRAYNGSLGRSPQRGPRAELLVRSGAKPPKAKGFQH